MKAILLALELSRLCCINLLIETLYIIMCQSEIVHKQHVKKTSLCMLLNCNFLGTNQLKVKHNVTQIYEREFERHEET